MDSSQWQWQETEKGSFLTCKLLADWQHGFFSNHFHQQSPEVLIKYLHPQASSYRVKQIHSNIVVSTNTINDHQVSNDNLVEADGIITEKSLQSVWCASADCTPVLIADSHTGKVAAIHSGWRGTSTQIVANAIALFQSQGSKLENLLFALGPAIDAKVYQVDKEVAIKVLNTIIPDAKNSDSEDLLTQGYEFPNQVIILDDEVNKVKLNVTQVINLQIQKQGISPDNIAIAPYCTYQNPEYFFSYRRTHEKNVQWSTIISC
ncbi:uncharacterized conserved protein [Geminocystis sp. NIES-3708]|uniref:peptidoglycan editing factor PgeF n=1 Tax=Geminocystis sp. NIES-3708 TaxID=1615909 RepID=UPI0005FCC4A9|nr:peptidoglycan editing factor PgeF [Geminocystis sp. NIES-3708]BAQ62411.1 uncharacterized conserved protein [Geminocystis sp. NIES-3708]